MPDNRRILLEIQTQIDGLEQGRVSVQEFEQGVRSLEAQVVRLTTRFKELKAEEAQVLKKRTTDNTATFEEVTAAVQRTRDAQKDLAEASKALEGAEKRLGESLKGVTKDVGFYESQLARLQGTTEATQKNLQGISASTARTSSDFARLKQAARETGVNITELNSRLRKNRDEQAKLNAQLKRSNNAAVNKNIRQRITAYQREEKALRSLSIQFQRLRSTQSLSTNTIAADVRNLAGPLRNLNAGFRAVAGSMGSFGTQLSGVTTLAAGTSAAFLPLIASLAAVTAATREIVQNSSELEVTFDRLQALTGLTGESFEFLKDRAFEVAAGTTRSAKEIADSFLLVGSALPQLLKAPDVLSSVASAARQLADAGGIETQQAVITLSRAINTYKIEAEDAARITDVLAEAQRRGAVFIPQLDEGLTTAAASAKAAGINFQETVAALEALGQGGLTGRRAGTGLAIVLRELARESEKVSELLGGVSIEGKTLTEVIDLLADKNLSLAQASDLVNARGAKYLLTLIEQREQLRALSDSLDVSNAAMDQASINTDNLASASGRLGSAFQDLFSSFVESNFGQRIITFVDQLTEKVNRLSRALRGVNNELQEENLRRRANFGGLGDIQPDGGFPGARSADPLSAANSIGRFVDRLANGQSRADQLREEAVNALEIETIESAQETIATRARLAFQTFRQNINLITQSGSEELTKELIDSLRFIEDIDPDAVADGVDLKNLQEAIKKANVDVIVNSLDEDTFSSLFKQANIEGALRNSIDILNAQLQTELRTALGEGGLTQETNLLLEQIFANIASNFEGNSIQEVLELAKDDEEALNELGNVFSQINERIQPFFNDKNLPLRSDGLAKFIGDIGRIQEILKRLRGLQTELGELENASSLRAGFDDEGGSGRTTQKRDPLVVFLERRFNELREVNELAVQLGTELDPQKKFLEQRNSFVDFFKTLIGDINRGVEEGVSADVLRNQIEEAFAFSGDFIPDDVRNKIEANIDQIVESILNKGFFDFTDLLGDTVIGSLESITKQIGILNKEIQNIDPSDTATLSELVAKIEELVTLGLEQEATKFFVDLKKEVSELAQEGEKVDLATPLEEAADRVDDVIDRVNKLRADSASFLSSILGQNLAGGVQGLLNLGFADPAFNRIQSNQSALDRQRTELQDFISEVNTLRNLEDPRALGRVATGLTQDSPFLDAFNQDIGTNTLFEGNVSPLDVFLGGDFTQEQVSQARSILRERLTELNKVTAEEFEKSATDLEDQIERDFQILNTAETIALAVSSIVDTAFAATASAIQAQIAIIDASIDAQLRRVDEALLLAQDGNAEALAFEKSRLEELNREREAQVRREQRLARAMAVANAALAITQIFASPALPDPISKIASAAAVGAALVAQLSATKNTVGGAFFEGTPYLTADEAYGKTNASKDNLIVRAHPGEAIIPTARNEQYPGLSAAFIRGDVEAWAMKNLPVLPAPTADAPMVVINVDSIKEEVRELRDAIQGSSTPTVIFDKEGIRAMGRHAAMRENRQSKLRG